MTASKPRQAPPPPSEILLLSPRRATDATYEELARRIGPVVAPVPVRVVHGDGADDRPPRPGAALVTGGQPGAAALLQALADDPEGWRWVHLTASGPDHIEAWGAIPGQPLVTYSRGVNARSIAEWALAAILHFARDFDHYAHLAAAPLPPGPRWDRRWARELSGLQVLVVGAGAAGGELATLCRPLGMVPVGVARNPSGASPAFERIVPPEALDAELAEAHVVVVLLPLTPSTRGLFDAARIARLRTGSVLLVASRGGIVDERAVLEAVRSARLRGAAFDVFETEPLPDDSPFWGEPRILVTPHVAGTTDRFMEHTAHILGEIWAAWRGAGDENSLDSWRYASPHGDNS